MDYILRLVNIIGGSISLLTTLFIIISYITFHKLQKPGSNFVFFQAICDFFFTFKFILVIVLADHGENLYDPDQPYGATCVMVAFGSIFFGSASVTWNFMMSVVVLQTFFRQDSPMSSIYYHLYVWISTLIFALPALIFGKYQPVPELGCWISNEHIEFRFFFVVPLCAYLLLSVAFLAFVLLQMSKNDSPWDSIQNSQVAKQQFRVQMIKYIIIFIIFWTPVAILRFPYISPATLSSNTSILLALCVVLQACANSIVWATSPQFIKLMVLTWGKRPLSSAGYQEIPTKVAQPSS